MIAVNLGVQRQTRGIATAMQPQAHWAVASRCICPAAQLVLIFASPQRSPASINTKTVLPDQELGRCVPATAANPLPLCVAFAMATLYTVLSPDSHATREEIPQHLYPDDFLLSRLRIVGSITTPIAWPSRLLITRKPPDDGSCSSTGYSHCLAFTTQAVTVATGASDVGHDSDRMRSHRRTRNEKR